MRPYHSALKDELVLHGELDYYEKDGSIVMRHDILDGCRDEFWRADVVYTEPAWRDGYQKFSTRADITNPRPYNEYLDAIRTVITTLSVPAYVVMGKHMVRRLEPDRVVEIRLHGYKCLLGVWNTEPISVYDNYSALQYVVDHIVRRCVLDFCCGYGNTAASAVRAGKQFVCSDLNGKCVYYIAREIMGARL